MVFGTVTFQHTYYIYGIGYRYIQNPEIAFTFRMLDSVAFG